MRSPARLRRWALFHSGTEFSRGSASADCRSGCSGGAGGGGAFGCLLCLEPALGVYRRATALACRGHSLAVAMVVHVAGHETPLSRRVGCRSAHREAPLCVSSEPLAEDLDVGSVPDGHEEPFDREDLLAGSVRLAEPQGLHLIQIGRASCRE